jgi:hypothetical protein
MACLVLKLCTGVIFPDAAGGESLNFIPAPKGDALTDEAFLQSAVQQRNETDAHSRAAELGVGFAAVAIAFLIAFVVLRRYAFQQRPKPE